MSDSRTSSPRPVSLFTIVFLMVLFGAFALVVRHYYIPTLDAPFNVAPQNLSKDNDWRASQFSRRAALTELHEKEAKQIESYGWVDQKAGVVHLPVRRAMELTVQQYGAKK